MVTGIEHVAIASPDPHRLAGWYVEHLNFVINYQSANSKTVFIKAARSISYGEVAKVIDSIKGAGASPIGLQLDDLN